MFKLWSKKAVTHPLKPVKSMIAPAAEASFPEAGKPVDGRTQHQSPRPPREEASREGAEPEHRPA